jgi:hypothetical protein
VGGALTAFDLPDLIATVAPRRVLISGMKNQMMQPADKQLVEIETEYPVSVFKSQNASGNIKVLPGGGNLNEMVDWAFSVNR